MSTCRLADLDRLQRIAQRQPFRLVIQPPLTILAQAHLARQGFPGQAGVLFQGRQAHAVIQQCGDDFAQAVVPFVSGGGGQQGVGFSLGVLVIPDGWLAVFEVGVGYLQGVLAVFVERHQHGVGFTQKQPSAGLE